MAELLVFLLYMSALIALALAGRAWIRPRRPHFVWPALAWPLAFLLIMRFSVVAKLRGGTGMDYEYEWVLMPALVFGVPATFIAGAAGAVLLPPLARAAAILMLAGGVLVVVTA